MQRVIIVDGPDRCGKSSISLKLSQTLNVPRFKNDRESMFFEKDPDYFVHALKYGDPYFVSYLRQSGASIILDRSFPSEWVYSRAFNRQTNHDMLRMVDTMYASVGAKIVVPYRSSYDGIQDNQFKSIDTKMLVKIDELYCDFLKWTSCKTLRLCVDGEDINAQIEQLLAFV